MISVAGIIAAPVIPIGSCTTFTVRSTMDRLAGRTALAPQETRTMMTSRATITGGGGTRLHLVETGNARVGPFYSFMAFRSVGSPGAAS